MSKFDDRKVNEVFSRVNQLTGRLLSNQVAEFSVRIEKGIVFFKEVGKVKREAFRLTEKKNNE